MTATEAVRRITPLRRPIDAQVTLPGSKSITNRALVAAALAPGESRVTGALFADDTEAMLAGLRALGVDVTADADQATVIVRGGLGSVDAGGAIVDARQSGTIDARQSATIDARQSGTTARFLAPACALGAGRYRLDGDPQLRARPMGPLVTALRHLGVEVAELDRPGHLPLAITGAAPWPGGTVALGADVSSQFASGLMLAGPATGEGITLELEGELVSVPYLELTAAVMRAFGAAPAIEGRRAVVPPTAYRPAVYAVEPDASAASYLFAAAVITGGRVTVAGLHEPALQGDWAFVDVLGAMGARVGRRRAGRLTVEGTGALHGVDVDLRHLSDTAPTLAVAAAFADGPTRVRGIGFIRAKETDRVAAVVTELRRLGVDAAETADGFVVHPSPGGPHAGRVHTYGDHRMAMAFAIAGLRTPGVEIADPDCVTKTFPGFWTALDALG